MAEMKKSNGDPPRPYKVSFPGQYDPYELMRPSKDPRLGQAQKTMEEYYKGHGFKDDDGDDVDVGSSEDETQDYYYPDPPIPVFNIPFGSSLASHYAKLPYADWAKTSYKQKWKKTRKQRVKNEAKVLKKTDCECAEAAINFYNQIHGTDYKIVETLGSYAYYSAGFYHHCNFRAQCKSHPSPPKLFFAELQRVPYDQLMVKNCMPLDDGLVIHSRFVRGCKFCGNHLLHPVNGFEVGRMFAAEGVTHHRVS